MLLPIKWHTSVRNDEVRRLTGQHNLTAIEQSRRLKLFGRTLRTDYTQMPKASSQLSLSTPSCR